MNTLFVGTALAAVLFNSELFVFVEDRINARKAMAKETACTFEKFMKQPP